MEGEGGGKERERDGSVAVGAIRCLEPRVVGNHLLGVKNSKLRVDMGLCLHRLQPTTGLRGTDVPVIPVALSLYIFLAFPPLLAYKLLWSSCKKKEKKKKEERKRRGKRKGKGGTSSKRLARGGSEIVYICICIYVRIYIYV